MNAFVTATVLISGPSDSVLSLTGSLTIWTEDGWYGKADLSIPFSPNSATVNAAIKQAAADAVKAQHGVPLDPATEILLVGGAS